MGYNLILHGEHSGPRQPAKLFFLVSIIICTAMSAWLNLRRPANLVRDSLLVACGAVFALRTILMVLYLLPRRSGDWCDIQFHSVPHQ